MRESLKAHLTPEYVWEEFKTRKGYTYANIPVYIGLLMAVLMILICMFVFLIYSPIITLFFFIFAVFTVAISVILTRRICKRKVIAFNNEPMPEIVFDYDVCADKESHYDSEAAGVDSWTLYFEKAGKIRNYRKYDLYPESINVGDQFYTARFSFNGDQLKFYSAKAYRLHDLTEEELSEEDAKYSAEEHKMFTTMLDLEVQPKLQIRSNNPSWSNDDRFYVSTEGELRSLTPMKRLAAERFDGDLVSAAEYILRYADDDFKNQLVDCFDSTESLVFLSVSHELTKKCYRK